MINSKMKGAGCKKRKLRKLCDTNDNDENGENHEVLEMLSRKKNVRKQTTACQSVGYEGGSGRKSGTRQKKKGSKRSSD